MTKIMEQANQLIMKTIEKYKDENLISEILALTNHIYHLDIARRELIVYTLRQLNTALLCDEMRDKKFSVKGGKVNWKTVTKRSVEKKRKE